MKVIIGLILSLSILSGQAMATVHDGLQTAFEEMVYSVEVDGDETAATEQFFAQLTELQKQGLENADLVNFSLAQIKDQKVAAQMAEAFQLIEADQMSADQLKELVTVTRAEAFKKGASWNGSAALATAAVVVVVAGAVAVYLKTRHETAKNSISNVR